MRNLITPFAFSILTLLAACGGKTSPDEGPAPDPGPDPSGDGTGMGDGDGDGTGGAACVKGGCSGTLCAEEGGDGMMTTCEWKDEYACYQQATCERQSDGTCGWTETTELTSCLSSPPSQGAAPM